MSASRITTSKTNGFPFPQQRRCSLRCSRGDPSRESTFATERSCRIGIGVILRRSALEELEKVESTTYWKRVIITLRLSAVSSRIKIVGISVGHEIIIRSIERRDIPVPLVRRPLKVGLVSAALRFISIITVLFVIIARARHFISGKIWTKMLKRTSLRLKRRIELVLG